MSPRRPPNNRVGGVSDSINGFSVEKASIKSLIKVLEKAVIQREELILYAKNNQATQGHFD